MSVVEQHTQKDEPRSPRAFISYAHENGNPALADAVFEFSNQLRADGITTILDQYNSHPAEGWPLWMDEQIRKSDFVLMVCTETYIRRVHNEEGEGIGLGARWEGNLIYNSLYAAGAVTEKFIAVQFEPGNQEFIPLPISGNTRYELPKGYEALYRLLTDQPLHPPGKIGSLRKLPALSTGIRTSAAEFLAPDLSNASTNLPPLLSDYSVRHRELIRKVKIELDKTRLLTLIGEAGSGKTPIALQVAAEELKASDKYPDGVWLIELYQDNDAPALRDRPDYAAEVAARTLWTRSAPQGPSLQGLVDLLKPKRLLLILDDCEDSVESCRRLVIALLDHCPNVHILASSQAALNVLQEDVLSIPPLLKNRDVLFKGHPLLGWLFSLPPLHFAGLISFVSVLFLLLPARLVGVHSIPYDNPAKHFHGDTGLWHKPGWVFMYPVGLPFIFLLMATLSDRVRRVIERLSSKKRRVIVNMRGEAAWDYPLALSEALADRARFTTWATLILSVGITLASSWGLWWGICHHDRFPSQIIPDWDNAWGGRIGTSNWEPPKRTANILFDLVAYSFMTGAIFLATFWLFKFAMFLSVFAETLAQEHSSYRFNPMLHDPRLGLQPMGVLFNMYLGVIILFQACLFVHRLQILDQHKWGSSGRYFASIIGTLHTHGPVFTTHFFALDALDPGEKIGLLVMSIPIIVLCYFPLYRLRLYVGKRCDDLADTYDRLYSSAKERDDEQEARMYKNKSMALKSAELWPNGDAMAARLLCIVLMLALAATLPPLIVLLPLGLLPEMAWKWISQRIW